MIATDYTTATQITVVVASFLLLLALIGLVRSLFSPSSARRLRVGVFLETRELDPPARKELEDTLVAGPPLHESEAPTRTDWPRPP